jgi:hypothetical protein
VEAPLTLRQRRPLVVLFGTALALALVPPAFAADPSPDPSPKPKREATQVVPAAAVAPTPDPYPAKRVTAPPTRSAPAAPRAARPAPTAPVRVVRIVRPVIVYARPESTHIAATPTPKPKATAPKPARVAKPKPKPRAKPTPTPVASRLVAGERREPVAVLGVINERNSGLLLAAAAILAVAGLGSGAIALGIHRELQAG